MKLIPLSLSNLQNKNKGAVKAALLMLLFAALPFSVSAISTGTSAFPGQYVQTIASVSVQPSPVGVGQMVWVQGLIEPLPPTYNDRFANLTLSITHPDGTVNIIGPFFSESGLLDIRYTTAQIGTYTMQLNYGGQFFSSRNLTYLPVKSPAITLRVQQEPVLRKTWTVDDNGPADFSSIQAAVNAAGSGDFIFVRNGVYKEPQVTIRKPLTLIGEDKTATILDGDPGRVRLYIQNTSNVVVRGFTIRNGCGLYSAFSKDVVVTENVVSDSLQGIILIGATNSTVSRNLITKNNLTLLLSEGSHNNTISENIFTSNNGDAIWLDHSYENSVIGNYVAANGLGTKPGYHVYGIRLSYSISNTVFHNDIIGNFEQADGWMSFNNTWDNGYPSGGNYWSNYKGQDINHDGIGDTPYIIDANNTDRYPRMYPLNPNVVSNVQPTISINIQPNPVAIGNTVLINATVTPPPPTSNDRFGGLTLTITRPDGTINTMGPFSSDSNGLLETYYTPTQVGNYRIQLSYPGQYFASRNVTYMAAKSSVLTLSVQVTVGPRTWIVDDDLPADFRTIQEAINAASSGDTILVRSGTYHENIVVNKSLSLVGEGADRTTISGKTTGKIVIVSASRVTITGFTIQGSGGTQPKPYDIGIFFANPVTSSNISHNIIAGHGYGISLRGSFHSVESNYVIENTIGGIYLNGSSNNAITRNNVTGPGKTGIFIAWPSSNNVLRYNKMTGSELNLHLYSFDLQGFINDIDTSNTVNGKPVYYWISKTNQVVPRDAGTVYLINSVNMTVQDLELSNSAMGVLLAYTNGSTVQRNNITNCSNGIRVQSSSNNTLKGNNIYAGDFGIVLVGSSGNTVINNTVSASSMQGITVMLSSFGNLIYHNSFSNLRQAQADLVNTWDNGYPSGGNYWSDYNGTDANGDGIGDTPYVISGNNTDRYPLVKEAKTQSNTTTSAASKEGKTSTSQPKENESKFYEETTPIDEEPTSTPEDGQQPFTAPDYPLSAAIIPIALLLGVATAIAFGGPLLLLRRKR